MLLVSSAALAFQVVEPAKTPYERRGLYHATVHGRFVSQTGQPVAGVHVQLNAGRPRSLPLAALETGADGRFAIHDVNSIYPPYLAYFPPEEWLDGRSAVIGESGSNIDLGTIRLVPDTMIRVAVEIVGGPPLGPDDREPTVVVEGERGFPRVVAEKIGSEEVLHGITFDVGYWEVSLFTNSKSEVYRAPFHLERGRRDQKSYLRLLRDTVKPASDYHSEGKMEISEVRAPRMTITREFRATGRVLAPDGSPVEGAIVNTFHLPPWNLRLNWVRSGSDGKYDLRFRSTMCLAPAISYGDTDYWNLYRAERNAPRIPCEERLRGPRDIVMPQASQLSIHVEGVDASRVRAYWWHDSFGWQRFPSLRPWVSASSFMESQIKVEADGYLPLTHKFRFPHIDWSQNEKPPAEMPLEFRFDGAGRRTLTVLGYGKPLGGAIIDIESIVNLESDERRQLATYKTPTDGQVGLLGGDDQLIEAFVYADGFEPQRTVWNTGVPLVVDLAERVSSLVFPASSTVVAARVRNAQSPRAVQTVTFNAAESTFAHVAKGVYDITCYSAQGQVAGYQRLTVAPGNTLVDCSIDHRPRLTVRYPPGGWRVSVSDSTPRGGATDFVAMLLVPGVPGSADVGTTLERETTTESLFAISHAGKVHIEARSNSRSLTLWRDLDVKPCQSLVLSVPQGTATLRGSMRTYGGGLERSDHGFAGPRLQLIADNPSGWSLTEYIPQRDAREGDARHHFTMASVPAGSYHLYQHLIGKPATYNYGGHTRSYTEPIAAWGGIPVKLEPNQTTELPDFIDYRLADLQVRVADTTGRLVEHATLRIRDRMSESWRLVQENPAQLEQAAHPIPYPAAARIIAGTATLPRIREGWLDLGVETDSGAIFGFTVPVSPVRELRLTLPSGAAK